MKRFIPILAVLLALVFPLATALADQLNYSVDVGTVASSPSGGVHSVKTAGNGIIFVDLDTDPSTSFVYTFEVNTSVANQGQSASYPVNTTVSAQKVGGIDFRSNIKLLVKDPSTPCASSDFSGATSSANVSYPTGGSSVVLCVQATAPLTSALNGNFGQVQIQVSTQGVAHLSSAAGVRVRFMVPSPSSNAQFWISDGNFVPQWDWNYTDAAGNSLGPNNFSIVYNKTKITSTNPGQYYANFWIPGANGGDVVLHVTVPQGFSLSADPSGVSTKVYVGSANINFADPISQTEYTRNHDFTIDVGPVSNQDVYMTVHLNYANPSTNGLLAWPQLNPYTFSGQAASNGAISGYDIVSNISTTINGVLKK